MPFEDKYNETRLAERFAREARDFSDLQNEIAGRDVGRIGRFLSDGVKNADPSGKARQEHAETLTRLQLVLLNDPAYAALYDETAQALNDAQSRLDRLLERVATEIESGKNALMEALDQAANLPDGTKVFRDKNGDARTRDGSLASDELVETIVWRGNEPSYEDIQEQIERLARLRAIEAKIHSGQAEIGDLQIALGNANDVKSPDELHDTQKRAEDIVDDVESSFAAELERDHIAPETERPNVETSSTIAVPEL